MSTALIAQVDPNAEELLKEASSFGLLPAGPYEFTIREAEVIPFAKSGKYESHKCLNLQLRIIDGSPVGAGRIVFKRIPLFMRWLPTAKNPQGAVISDYFDFFLALGVSKEDVAAGKLPALEELGGKRIGGRIKVNEPDDYNDEKWNEFVAPRAPKEIAGVREAGASAVGSAFQPKAQESSPWGSGETKADSELQAAADNGGKAF